jgi:hypothetical protein
MHSRNYFNLIANSGLSFFFSICCLAKSAVTNANAPQVTLASLCYLEPYLYTQQTSLSQKSSVFNDAMTPK